MHLPVAVALRVAVNESILVIWQFEPGVDAAAKLTAPLPVPPRIPRVITLGEIAFAAKELSVIVMGD